MAAKYEDRSSGGTPGAPPRAHGPRLASNSPDRGLLDDTLPPQPLKELLAAGGANLFVLSADNDLVDTVQRAGGEHYPVFAVQQWSELEGAIVEGRCGIALLDTELVGGKLLEYITALEKHASRVVTLVAADRVLAQELMGYLSDRRIHRLLIKPAALGITKLLVESAVNRCLQFREAAGTANFDVFGPGRAAGRPRRWPRIAMGATAAFALAAAAAWFWGPPMLGDRLAQPGQAPSSGAPIRTAERSPDSSERFAQLLERGAQAFDAGHLAAPTGDNALDYYLTVLSMEPSESTARARLAAVVDALFGQAESALLANSLDDAGAALAGVRRADPGSSRLAFLDAQLARATAARAAASARAKPASTAREAGPTASQPAAGAAPTELDSLLVIATTRIARGQLLAPQGDSAFEYLRRATQLNGGDPRVVRGRAALASALLDAARVALGKNALDDATKFVGAAKELGAPAEAFKGIERELTGAQQASADRRHTDLLDLATTRLRAGALLEPAGDSALDYLRNLQNDAPNFAGLSSVWDDWIAGLTSRVRQAIATRSWAAGEAALAAMASAPRGAAAAAPLREQLETERLQTQYLATASPAGELKVIEAPPPVYPPEALRLGLQGWVELEFVVDRIGHPKNIVVVGAEPSGRFDQAALTAVAKYRFAPFENGGHVYERRVRQRIRFALH